MSRWFRFYDDALNDPKVQQLSAELFKTWVNVLCIASKCGGIIQKKDLSFSLRLGEPETKAAILCLVEHGLLEDRGDILAPHNWDGRQYDNRDKAERLAGAKGDPTAADRMRRHRNKTVTASVTEPYQEQNRTETDKNRAEPHSLRNFKRIGIREGSGPKHGAMGNGVVYIHVDTPEWKQYADQYEAAKGFEPKPIKKYGGTGCWFKVSGEAAE